MTLFVDAPSYLPCWQSACPWKLSAAPLTTCIHSHIQYLPSSALNVFFARISAVLSGNTRYRYEYLAAVWSLKRVSYTWFNSRLSLSNSLSPPTLIMSMLLTWCLLSNERAWCVRALTTFRASCQVYTMRCLMSRSTKVLRFLLLYSPQKIFGEIVSESFVINVHSGDGKGGVIRSAMESLKQLNLYE